MVDQLFHPLVATWFRTHLGPPTDPQRLGWPEIAAGRSTLIAAPTGSGKTLTAFLVCLDRLVRQWFDGTLPDGVEVVYVSPLKALSNDIQRNLETPLAQIRELAETLGYGSPPIRTMVRTGDTPAAERAAMLRKPPHILVTTPESLFIVLTSAKSRETLRGVKTVIVDEIHALARDKRGSHLALTLERLEALCDTPPVRIGLSATQKPIEEIAAFLVGCERTPRPIKPTERQLTLPLYSPDPPPSTLHSPPSSPALHSPHPAPRPCSIIDTGHIRRRDLGIEVPPSELEAVCSHEQWAEIYEQLTELIQSHRSTLIFVNTRRLAERVAFQLTQRLGPEAVASHHGSLSRQIRHDAEQRLKSGELRAIVATASLEMGIDIGYIDLVCQIGSPRAIATFLQRVGRSGHSLGALPKGRLFPLTRDELLECLALLRAVQNGELDRIEMPVAPLDILAQQIVAAAACDDWREADLFDLCRRAWPYRELTRAAFDEIVAMLSEGVSPKLRRGAHLHRDRINGILHARRGARMAAIMSGGAIPETAQFRVLAEPDGTFVGTVEEDFALESMAGDVFLLGNNSWRIKHVRGGEVVVRDAQGAPPSIPFWFGEAPGRTIELSTEVSRLRQEIAEQVRPLLASMTSQHAVSPDLDTSASPTPTADPAGWLAELCRVDLFAAEQAVRYVAAQVAAVGLVPTCNEIVFERFFDESGGMQVVIHAPLGARINRGWGLALRKRFCRSFDFELQASADDDGVVLSVGPQHSFPLEDLGKMLNPQNAAYLLEQALLAAPMFQTRWRWNVTRALAVMRFDKGKKVPPHLQRFRADDLLAAVFPEQAGCLENHHGDLQVPDHPLVRQTVHDCLTEAMDLRRWLDVLADVQAGRTKIVCRDTREPSPFSHELINANPYAFLDPAAAEERRTRAVSLRRGLSIEAVQDLGRLDPEAIDRVRADAWPVVRDVNELHDALCGLVLVTPDEAAPWMPWFDDLMRAGRATRVRVGEREFRIAAESWPVVAAAFGSDVVADPPLALPESLQRNVARTDAYLEIIRGRIQHSGPITAAALATLLGLDAGLAFASLEAIEGSGVVLRGSFTPQARAASGPREETVEWCDRRLLARIHRLTLDGLRRKIEPVSPADYLRFLTRHHRLLPTDARRGPAGVKQAVWQLAGFEAPAAAWEDRLLAPRVADYEADWLDQLFMSGELVWGRLRPPRRDPQAKPSAATLGRAVPIALAGREDLGWLLPAARVAAEGPFSSNAQTVLDALRQHGALFIQELRAATDLLPAHLEEALRELAALGLVTSDGFASIRAIVGAKRSLRGRTARRRRTAMRASTPAGRWSLFPGWVKKPPQEEYLARWCQQLLRRYGVVFRDVLARESAAPSWYELAPVFRQLERRGELRGGRFIAQVAGEQFAAEETVQELRRVRDLPPNEPWLIIAATDPLNLLGIIVPGARVPATSAGTLAIEAGRFIAVRTGEQVEFLEEQLLERQVEISRGLVRGRRVETTVDAGNLPGEAAAAPPRRRRDSQGFASPRRQDIPKPSRMPHRPS